MEPDISHTLTYYQMGIRILAQTDIDLLKKNRLKVYDFRRRYVAKLEEEGIDPENNVTLTLINLFISKL